MTNGPYAVTDMQLILDTMQMYVYVVRCFCSENKILYLRIFIVHVSHSLNLDHPGTVFFSWLSKACVNTRRYYACYWFSGNRLENRATVSTVRCRAFIKLEYVSIQLFPNCFIDFLHYNVSTSIFCVAWRESDNALYFNRESRRLCSLLNTYAARFLNTYMTK